MQQAGQVAHTGRRARAFGQDRAELLHQQCAADRVLPEARQSQRTLFGDMEGASRGQPKREIHHGIESQHPGDRFLDIGYPPGVAEIRGAGVTNHLGGQAGVQLHHFTEMAGVGVGIRLQFQYAPTQLGHRRQLIDPLDAPCYGAYALWIDDGRH